jgi:hypothetical protein
MWTIVILFGGGGSVNLIYQSESRARADFELLSTARNPSDENYNPQVGLTDEFGTSATIDIAEVICHTLQDIRKVQAGAGELQLVTMRANVATQQKANRDPTLRLMGPGGLVA